MTHMTNAEYQKRLDSLLEQYWLQRQCPACSQNIPASKTAVGQVEKLCAKHKSELDSHLTAILGQPQEETDEQNLN